MRIEQRVGGNERWPDRNTLLGLRKSRPHYAWGRATRPSLDEVARIVALVRTERHATTPGHVCIEHAECVAPLGVTVRQIDLQVHDEPIAILHQRVRGVGELRLPVKGGTQFGRVGSGGTYDSIPIMPDGSLDPAFDPNTGLLKASATKSPQSFVPDAGHIYATALALAGIPKSEQKGKNTRPPLAFIKK